MDQGVIRSLQAYYRRRVVRLCLKAFEKDKKLSKISILQGMKSLVSSWNDVSKETIINCFGKAGISEADQQAAVADEGDPFKGLSEELEMLRGADSAGFPEDASAESFAAVDSDAITTATVPTNAEILSEVRSDYESNVHSDEEDEVEEIEDESPKRPSKQETEDALDTLQNVALYSQKYGKEIQALTLKLEKLINNERISNIKQQKMTDYLKKL